MIERVNDVIYAGEPLPGNPLTTVPPSPSSGGEGEIGAPAETDLAVQLRDPRVVLDAVKQMAVLFYIRLGASRRMAARQVGCCHRTIARAAARDPDFAHDLSRAEAEADEKCLQLISRATDQEKYWRAAAWVLERRNPEEFGPRRPHTYSGGHVVELFTRYLHAVLPNLPAECRDTLLDQFDDVVGELLKDPNALPDRAELMVKEVPPAPVTAPPVPPPLEFQCPREEAAARAWIRGLSAADSERIWERARRMPDAPDWNYWRKMLREEGDKQYLKEVRERKERKRRRALGLPASKTQGTT